jgi:ankyrin repeat protein
MSILDKMGRTPLHWAAECGQSALVRTLLREGARTWLSDRRGETALHPAARNGRRKAAELLARKKFFRTRSASNKEVVSSALYFAAGHGHNEVIQLLLDMLFESTSGRMEPALETLQSIRYSFATARTQIQDAWREQYCTMQQEMDTMPWSDSCWTGEFM